MIVCGNFPQELGKQNLHFVEMPMAFFSDGIFLLLSDAQLSNTYGDVEKLELPPEAKGCWTSEDVGACCGVAVVSVTK